MIPLGRAEHRANSGVIALLAIFAFACGEDAANVLLAGPSDEAREGGASASGGAEGLPGGNVGSGGVASAGSPSIQPWDPTTVPEYLNPPEDPNGNLHVRDLATNGTRVYVIRSSTKGEVHYTDNGIAWSSIPLSDGEATPLTLAAGGAHLTVGLSSLRIYHSASTTLLTLAATPAKTTGDGLCDVTSIHFADATAYATLSGCSPSVVLESSDGGRRWTHMPRAQFRSNARSVTHFGASVYVGAEAPAAVFYTDNGGESWTETSEGLGEGFIVELDATNSHVFLKQGNVIGKRQLYRLGHDAWVKTAMAGVPGGNSADVDAIATDRAATLFVAVRSVGLFLSTDGGGTFTSIPTGITGDEHIHQMVVAGDQLYIGTSEGNVLMRSR